MSNDSNTVLPPMTLVKPLTVNVDFCLNLELLPFPNRLFRPWTIIILFFGFSMAKKHCKGDRRCRGTTHIPRFTLITHKTRSRSVRIMVFSRTSKTLIVMPTVCSCKAFFFSRSHNNLYREPLWTGRLVYQEITTWMSMFCWSSRILLTSWLMKCLMKS